MWLNESRREELKDCAGMIRRKLQLRGRRYWELEMKMQERYLEVYKEEKRKVEKCIY